MQRVNAKQGLLVAWGGFTKDAIQEARNIFFSMRLWSAELPLKRIWASAEEEDSTYSSAS
jgi:predicted Mrr-cat superfamily restriction endonuclease